jgi:ATP-dependent DNA ligase
MGQTRKSSLRAFVVRCAPEPDMPRRPIAPRRVADLAALVPISHLSGMLWRSSAPKRQPPGFIEIEPCIPTRTSKPPVGPPWVHEIKHDGYRLIARKHYAAFASRLFDLIVDY